MNDSQNPQVDIEAYRPTHQLDARKPRALHWKHVFLGTFFLVILLIMLFLLFAKSIRITATDAQQKTAIVGAKIQLQNRWYIPIGNRLLILPGDYTVLVQAKGYPLEKQEIVVSRQRQQDFIVNLQPLPGSLQVVVNDNSKAEVFIDDEKVGYTSEIIHNISAGKHKISIISPLYEEFHQGITIVGKAQQQELAIALVPAWAYLTLDTNPKGANVFIDDVAYGITPLKVPVGEGERQVRFSLPGYEDHLIDTWIQRNISVTVPLVTLNFAPAILALATQPEQAAVLVDDKYYGATPLSISLASKKQHTIELFKPGFKRKTLQLTLAPEQKHARDIALIEDVADVRFTISPANATLQINGKTYTKYEQKIRLSTLPQKIVVKKPGYVTQTKTIVPNAKYTQAINIALLTKEQDFWKNTPDQYQSSDGNVMRLFKKPGKVFMGSSRQEIGRRSNEVPFEAKLTRSFYVSLHEVTNQQYRQFSAQHSSGHFKRMNLNANKKPVVNVSWQQAALYCNWLSKKQNLPAFYQTVKGHISGVNPQATGYRLVTEAEWDWLARNNAQSPNKVMIYPWGNEDVLPNKAIGNYADTSAKALVNFTIDKYNDKKAVTSSVGSYPANHKGLYDIDGNASEWVHDWYSDRTEIATTEKGDYLNFLGPNSGEFHVVRGASWAKGYLPQLRLAYRDRSAKGRHDIGFRIARYVGEPK